MEILSGKTHKLSAELLISGTPSELDEVNSYLMDQNNIYLDQLKDVTIGKYSFTTKMSNQKESIEMLMEEIGDLVAKQHLKSRLQKIVSNRYNFYLDKDETTHGLQGCISGDVKEVLEIQKFVENNGFGIKLASSDISYF
jgi:hypothetical protein